MVLAKRVDKKADIPDRLDRLVRYIADAPQKGEKLDQFWIGNCKAGTGQGDMGLAIDEMVATQNKNKRGSDSKSYHLIISFREGEKPPPDQLRSITDMYLKGLGYQEHQYAAGTHDNTQNYHIHVAINRVHPETGRMHTPFRDFHHLDRVSREVEKRFGLAVDVGIEEKREQGKAAENTVARDFEAQRWEQSFLGYCEEHKDEIDGAIKESASWAELQSRLAVRDLQFKPRSAGMVLADLDDKHHVRASSVVRSFSKSNLVSWFGPFEQVPEEQEKQKRQRPRQSRYVSKPTTRHPKTKGLWNDYVKKLSDPRNSIMGKDGKPVTSWKQYLMMMVALRDPLAVAIVVHQRQLINAMIPGAGRKRSGPRFTPAPGQSRRDKSPPKLMTAKELDKLPPQDRPFYLRINQYLEARIKAGELWTVCSTDQQPDTHERYPEFQKAQKARYDAALAIDEDLPGHAGALLERRIDIKGLRADVLSGKGVGRGDALDQAGKDHQAWLAAAIEGKTSLAAFRANDVLVHEAQEKQQERKSQQAFRKAWKEAAWSGWQYPGCKSLDDGRPAMPLRDEKGYLHDLYYPDRKDQKTRSGELKAGLHYIMHAGSRLDAKDNAPEHIFVVRDYHSAKTLHQVTGKPVAVTVGTDNLEPVIKSLKKQFPDSSLILAGEHGDREQQYRAIASRYDLQQVWPEQRKAEASIDAAKDRGFADRADRLGFAAIQQELQDQTGLKFDKPFISQEQSQKVWNEAKWANRQSVALLKGTDLGWSGLKQTPNGDLLIPAYDHRNRLQSIQRIDRDGLRHMVTGDVPTGSHFLLGKKHLAATKEIVLTTDFETALKVVTERKVPAAIAFRADNLEAASVALGKLHKGKKQDVEIGRKEVRLDKVVQAIQNIGI